MKILHTDKDETPALELNAEEFLQKNAAAINKAASSNDVVIDLSTGEPAKIVTPEKKKSNAAIWAVIIILILLIVAGLVFYFQLKAKKADENNGN